MCTLFTYDIRLKPRQYCVMFLLYNIILLPTREQFIGYIIYVYIYIEVGFAVADSYVRLVLCTYWRLDPILTLSDISSTLRFHFNYDFMRRPWRFIYYYFSSDIYIYYIMILYIIYIVIQINTAD